MAKFNPFNPNSVVAPTLFAGRYSQVDDICKKLSLLKHRMPASFFIYGERGIGKTALVKLIRYVSTLKDPEIHNLNVLTSYYAIEAGQNIGSVLQEAINKLTDEMSSGLINIISTKLGDIFKNGKFQIGAFGLSLGIEKNPEDESRAEIRIKDQVVSILSNILKGVQEEGQKDGILIILDEMHNLGNINSTASVLRNIVTTLDVENLGMVSFLLVGYEEDMEKFFSEDVSAKRTFDPVKLDVMPNNEAVEVLKRGFDSIKMHYNKTLLEENISVAGGYPHSIQIIGNHLIESDDDGLIGPKDWDDATFAASLTLQSKEFSNMYSFNKPLNMGDQILVFLAKKNKPLSKKEICDGLNQKNIYQYIPHLKKVGAIKENEEKKLYLQSQLFRTAILLNQFIRDRRALAQQRKDEKEIEDEK